MGAEAALEIVDPGNDDVWFRISNPESIRKATKPKDISLQFPEWFHDRKDGDGLKDMKPPATIGNESEPEAVK